MSNKLFSDNELIRASSGIDKTVKRGVIVIMTLWALGVLFSLALTGGIVFVAWHFISKVW